MLLVNEIDRSKIMVRTWYETPEDFPALKPGRKYLVYCLDIDKVRKPLGLEVVIEYIEGEQNGRRQTISLPLPIRPEGLTKDFFQACGQSIIVGRKIPIKSTVTGKRLLIEFGQDLSDNLLRPVAFTVF